MERMVFWREIDIMIVLHLTSYRTFLRFISFDDRFRDFSKSGTMKSFSEPLPVHHHHTSITTQQSAHAQCDSIRVLCTCSSLHRHVCSTKPLWLHVQILHEHLLRSLHCILNNELLRSFVRLPFLLRD